MNEVSEGLSRANAFVEERMFVRAIESCDKLVREHGEYAAVFRIRSAALASIGRMDDAHADAVRCMKLDPNNLDYAIHCSSILIALGSAEQAIALLEPRVGESTDGIIERVLSGAWAAKGEYQRAKAWAEAALSLVPQNDEFRHHLNGIVQHIAQQVRIGPARFREEPAIHFERQTPQARPSALRVQCRVLYALALREIAGQYENSRLGYLWAIIEPVVHLVVLGLFFSLLNHTSAPLGHNLYLFYLTGLVPFFMVIHTGSKVMHGLVANRSILLLPPITVLDILLARGFLSLLTELVVAVVILVIFNLLDIYAIPENGLLVLSALMLAWFLGLALGIFMAMLHELFKSWEIIWSQLTRVLYFCSGVFYVAEKMPPRIRDVLMWNPILQCVELTRSGFYSGFTPPWLHPLYVIFPCGCLLAAGLMLMRILDHHLGASE